MARPLKRQTPASKVTSVRLPEDLATWLDDAQWTIRAKKSELLAMGLELLLTLRAPGDRPDGYELSPAVAELLAELPELQQ